MNRDKKSDRPDKNIGLSSLDKDLWYNYTATIKPIKVRSIVDIELPHRKQLAKTITNKAQNLWTSTSLPAFETSAISLAAVSSSRRLKSSEPIDARLDLHGYSQTEAYREVVGFLERAYRHHHKIVLVITGKGVFRGSNYQRGILNEALPQWLNQPPLKFYVKKYTYAHIRDGGSGAYYIFIKS